MSHSADESFFDEKKDWSRKKDQILGKYLRPYLAKVRMLRQPILIVDGFAGRGTYGDGEPGSPIIICEEAKRAIVDYSADVRVVCIERSEQLFPQLAESLTAYPFAYAQKGSFNDFLGPVADHAAAGVTVFLYVDPFTPSSLDFYELEKVFIQLKNVDASVEVLINFLTPLFKRMAWQALKQNHPNLNLANAPSDDSESIEENSSIEKLDRIVGGNWWVSALKDSTSEEQLIRLMEGFGSNLGKHFKEICYAPVFEGKYNSNIKYHLIFGSRHPDALLLMNDNMIEACNQSRIENEPLFGQADLDSAICGACPEWTTRGDVYEIVIRSRFCQFRKKEIRVSIDELLRSGVLASKTGQVSRLNDNVEIRYIGNSTEPR